MPSIRQETLPEPVDRGVAPPGSAGGPSARTGRLGRGIALTVLAFGCLALVSAFARAASPEVSSATLVFFQYAVSLVLLLPWLLRGGVAGLGSRHLGLQAIWAVFGLSSQYLLFVALSYIPLVDAVLLANTSPLFIPLVVWLWVKAPIDRGLWASLVVGFVGIVLVLRPGAEMLSWATPLALAAGLCSAVGLVTISRLQRTEPASRMLFYYFALSSLLATPVMAATWSRPSPRAWLYLIALGASMALAQALTILAYREASPARLAPFNYSVVVFSALIGWLVWGEVPTMVTALGALLVCAGGILSTRRHGQDPANPPLARAPAAGG